MQIPNPGSDEAIAQGCTCPVLDNAHGIGFMGIAGRFVFNEGCPLHWPSLNKDGLPRMEQADEVEGDRPR